MSSRSICVLLLCVSTVSVACRRHADPSADFGAVTAETTPAPALPPLTLRDDSPNLLLTWVGEDGDFHVVERVDAVPAEHRQQVRVVETTQTTGTGALVYVANLTDKRPDGSYGVTTLPRTEWEKLGADRRQTRLEQVAPGAVTPGAAAPGAGAPGATPPDGSAQPPGDVSAAAGESSAVTAIVYGADWCKPCHEAERYLRSLGVAVTKKDIEESRAAQAEMREKLARVNRTGAGIPVIDVMGKIFVGYSPGPLKQAVDAARHATAPKRG